MMFAGSVLVALYIGVQIAQDDLGLPVLTLSLAMFCLAQRTLRVTYETLILSFLVFGYIVGNRGFAQITPIYDLPLFFGELGLMGGMFFVLFYIVFKKDFPFRLDFLGVAIIAWLLLSSVRVLFDIRQYGIVAMRDFAAVYYSLFFFVALCMGRT